MVLRDDKIFLTVQEVATLLQLSELTLYKYIREGKLEALEFGGHYRIEKTSLQRFINKHRILTNVLKKGDQ